MCVVEVEINPDYQMRFLISWTAHISEVGRTIIKLPDVGNLNMYVTDEYNNRYDHIELGGSATETVELSDGQSASGWYLFPQPMPNAREFVFHDDDTNATIDHIILITSP
jgi:hypothetical protein